MSGETEARRKRTAPPRAGTRVRVGGAGNRFTVSVGDMVNRNAPRTLAGAFLGLFAVVAFWAGLAGARWPHFVVAIAAVVAVFKVVIWALVQTPMRPSFDQRWRPHRHIEPLDLSGWRMLAQETGLRLRAKRGLPLIRGGFRGVALRLAYHQIGGARTVAAGALVHPFRARMEVRPRRAQFHTPHDRATGDADFDREFRCECAEVDPVERYLTPEIRERISDVEPELILVAGRIVEITCEGYVGDPDCLRGLLKLVAAIARS